jgi:malic enzyme
MIGLSVPEAFSVDDVSAMADDAIVLALANPDRMVPAVAGAIAGER